MTTTRPVQPWSAMPGWGIAADLTPPELINSRHVKVLRKWIVTGLVALLVVCTAGYVLAAQKRSSASTVLSDVQIRTAQLQADQRKYAGITKLQGSVTDIQTKISKLMSGDVDVVKLMSQIRTSLPATMTIEQESVTMYVAGATAAGTSKTSGLDTSGHKLIGSVTLAGDARTLDDLSAYADKLQAIPGIVNLLPISNTADKTGVHYSLSFGLTDVLLSHRFDVSKNGGK